MNSWRAIGVPGLLILASTCFVLMFFYTVLQRISYPLDIELIEGSLVNHTLRLMQGEPLYIKPSFEFTPNLYTPLYYYVSAAVSFVIGVGFLSLRLVSLLATMATVILIVLFVYRESKSSVAAYTAAGLYLATYAASGGWMDLARVDSFYVALLLIAVYWMRYSTDSKGLMISAIFFVLAFYAKQSALIAAAPLAAYSILFPLDNKSRFLWLFLFATLLLFSLGIADWLTERWFTYYTFVMPFGHPNNSQNTAEFWRHDLIIVMPMATMCAVLLIMSQLVNKKIKDAVFFFTFLFAMALTSYLTRINKGGYYNNLMPVYAALVIVFGIVLGNVIRDVHASRVALTAALLASLFQFWLLGYDPDSYIPKQEDWVESDRLIKDFRAINGNVYAMNFGFLGYISNKKNFSHNTAFDDIKLSRYQDWVGVDLHAAMDRRMTDLVEGIVKNNIQAVVLMGDKTRTPEARLGGDDAFILKRHYVGTSYDASWSQSTFWVRSWRTRTMFSRPDVLLYVKNPERKAQGVGN